MLEIILQTIAIVGAVIGGVGFIYKKGIKSGIDQACIENIESDITQLKETIGKKSNNSKDTHKDLYEKLEDTNLRVSTIANDVSYIKGKIDQALGTK